MELDQLRAFLAAIRSGSISGAAKEMFRTQPAISLKLRALESELGHPLLERRQRGVALTPAGEILRRRVEAILAELEALRVELSDLSARRIGRVSLGASDTVCLYLLPRVLKRFVQEYPGIELRLFTQITQRVLDLIHSDQVDFGIVTLPVETEGIESRKLYEDHFVLVFPPGHPLEKRRRIRPHDLRGYPLIHLKPETRTRQWIDGVLQPFGLETQIRMEVSTIEVVKRLVEVGLGISILPEISVAEELEGRRLKGATLWGMELSRSIGLAYKREKYFSLALQAFMEHLIAHARRL